MTENFTRKIVFHGRKIKVGIDSATSADGTPYQRDVVLHPGAVAILPIIDDERICLLRNHRPIVGETLWEIPAGTLEPNEVPEVAAVRELAEETGYRAGAWQKLCEFYPSPGVLDETTYLFVARDLTPGEQDLEADERLEPHTVKWKDALAWTKDGTIRDAKTMLALLIYAQNTLVGMN